MSQKNNNYLRIKNAVLSIGDNIDKVKGAREPFGVEDYSCA